MLIGGFLPAHLRKLRRPFMIRQNPDQRFGERRDVTHLCVDADVAQYFPVDRSVEDHCRQTHRHVAEQLQIGFGRRDFR